jgi:hypothetical protein
MLGTVTGHEGSLYEVAAAGEKFSRRGVDVSASPPEVWLWTEDGPSTHGARIESVAELDEARWDAHFRAAEAEWLRPLLRRLLSGEDVSADILDQYTERHGGPPPRRAR